MKYFLLILFMPALTMGIASCAKSEQEVQLRKNCIGVYLNVDERSFLVDNPEVFDNYENNEVLDVRYKELETEGPVYSETATCFIHFEFDKRVKVKSVKTN